MRQPRRHGLTLAISLALACQGAMAQPPAEGPARAREAYAAADAGYRSFAQADYAAAARDARRAVQLAPMSRNYWLLLAQALLADGRPDAAGQALDEAARTLPPDDAFLRLRKQVTAASAYMAASALFDALARNELAAAIAHGARATRLSPTNVPYRLALAHALLRAGQGPEAERVAQEALALLPGDPAALALKAYAVHADGKAEAALADLEQALAHPGRARAAERELRLVATHLALASGDAERALLLLAPLGPQDPEADARRDWAQRVRTGHPDFVAAVPGIDCTGAAATGTCALQAGPAPTLPGFADASLAYEAVERGQFRSALHHARLASHASPAKREWTLLYMQAAVGAGEPVEAERAADAALVLAAAPDGATLAQRASIRRDRGDVAGSAQDVEAAIATGQLTPLQEAALLVAAGSHPAARDRLAAAEASPLSSGERLQLAYLSLQAGDNDGALRAFQRADAQSGLPRDALIDAGHAAVRSHRTAEALAFLDRAVAAGTPPAAGAPPAAGTRPAPEEPLSEQRLYELKRFSSEVAREWGVLAGVASRNGPGIVPGFGPVGAPGDDRTTQVGVEAYWRPWGYRNGRYAEVFARGFTTTDAPPGTWTGSDSFQGTLGARVKPFSGSNLVLSLGRVVGPNVDDSWLAQAAYSLDVGSELRLDVPHWWTSRVYAEAGRYFGNGRDDYYALGSVMAGRSFRIGEDGRSAVLPHLFLGVEHVSNDPSARTSSSIGLGVSARRWFREDALRGPHSYLEVTLQYRSRLSGDQRMSGPYLSALVSY